MSLLNYNVLITGDCQNLGVGALQVIPSGGTSPYTIDWVTPNLGTDTLVTESLRDNLSYGVYVVSITDSTTPYNQNLVVNLYVSSGICSSIISSTNTTCNLPNGSLTVSAVTPYFPVSYYLYSTTNGYVTSGTSDVGFQIFSSLSPGIYYSIVTDIGGCSGNTGTCVISDSDNFNFGLFAVNNSNCGLGNTGKIYVTGLTGNDSYSYLWVPGNETTSSISGLTSGTYGVTVTNGGGCSITKTINVIDVPKVGINNFVTVPPGCFQSNGQITVVLTGGTAPYYYQFSNGQSTTTFNSSITYTGLTSGIYTVSVTDAGLCTTSGNTTLSTPDSFNVVSVSGTNSTCGVNNGGIYIEVQGGNTPYTFSITNSSGNTTSVTTISNSHSFTSLSSGSYTVNVSNPSNCTYETNLTLNNTNKFTINSVITDTTCGLNNGSISVNVNTPGTYTYQIPGNVILNSNLTNVVFSNLSAGTYPVTVTDSTGCVQTNNSTVGGSLPVQFSLIKTSCGDGAQGSITALINNGTPPYTLNWSSNVNGQTGIYVDSLSAGTYTLTVLDYNGCSLTKSTDITCSTNYQTYQTFSICSENFNTTSPTKTGVSEIFFQGYMDLIEGETNCLLQNAEFVIIVNVNNVEYTDTFYTTTLITDIPTNQDYVEALDNLLISISGIGSVNYNIDNNTLNIKTDCPSGLEYSNIIINLKINYNVCCVST